MEKMDRRKRGAGERREGRKTKSALSISCSFLFATYLGIFLC
jgi:hypothetical protein